MPSHKALNDLYMLPLREISSQPLGVTYASARKPSYFSSNSQSGWSNGAWRRASGIWRKRGRANDFRIAPDLFAQQFPEPLLKHLLAGTLAAALEPGFDLANRKLVRGCRQLYGDGEPRRRAER